MASQSFVRLTTTLLFILPFAMAGEAQIDRSLPRVLDPRLRLSLFAEQPSIVTPVGLSFDNRGRLLVIESHTHFPPEDYRGPAFDRIRVFEDTDGDGKGDVIGTFLDDTMKTMSVRASGDGWVYVATRMQVFRARDSDGDGRADERQIIATLHTPGDYPHNGLGGLCFGPDGLLYFGFGENLGEPYTLEGSDGTSLKGGGEGGNVYRCSMEGTGLEQVATGFWNPFGMCFDSAGRLYAVGNDPDASPPCRLVHVVDGGDYGYQFRYGRSGKHPLQAWDGELPGTLPMVAATSEAPSAVVQWNGQLYSTSWGEYCLERFTIKPHGASVRADREIVVQGDRQFRPVDVALAPDGALYFTDWVDRSYNVHGQGRIWRLDSQQPPTSASVPALSAELSAEEQRALDIREVDWEAIDSEDPFLHHVGMMTLRGSDLLAPSSLRQRESPRSRLAVLEAARRSELVESRRDELLRTALADVDSDVRIYALRWIADDRLGQFESDLDRLLRSDNLSTALFQVVVAAIEYLETGKVQRGKPAGERLLVDALRDASRPKLQALALKSLPLEHTAMKVALLEDLIRNSPHAQVQREAARTLSVSPLEPASQLRTLLANDSRLKQTVRADIRAGIRKTDGETVEVGSKPPVEDLETWLKLTAGDGDADAGWRTFFGQQHSVRCANCHRWDGRGADIGPDLTGVGKRISRRRLLQAILTPSQEVGPRYVPWNVLTQEGESLVGMSLGVRGEIETFVAADGRQFTLSQDVIESRKLLTVSIMPEGIHNLLSVEQLRDLVALLSL